MTAFQAAATKGGGILSSGQTRTGANMTLETSQPRTEVAVCMYEAPDFMLGGCFWGLQRKKPQIQLLTLGVSYCKCNGAREEGWRAVSCGGSLLDKPAHSCR